MALLEPFCRVKRYALKRQPTADDIATGGRQAFALCVSARDHVDEAIMQQCPKLRIISSFARGSDNIDVDAATKMGVWVATVSGVLAEPTADMTWALLLALARKVLPGDRLVRSGRFRGWTPDPPFFGLNVFGKTLGIIGMGQIGQAVARRAGGFRMQVLYWKPTRLSQAEEQELGISWVPRNELLAQSDFVCLCSPLTPRTYHQIGEAELHVMKPSALLINTSRGSEVDEIAVGEALAAGRLGGYAADVFEMEDFVTDPPVRSIPPSLLKQEERTVFTPHASTAVVETRLQIARAQAQAVLDVLQGKKPRGAVNTLATVSATQAGFQS